MVALFWAAMAVVAYTYFGYPMWIYLRSRLCPRPSKRAQIFPSVSIIMAVHNGAAQLRDKIDHLLTLNYPSELVEIIVISDGSSDGTGEILSEITHSRLRAVICEERRGKAAAVNEGIRRATGEILVFVDIRPRLEGGALEQLVSNFADPTVGCVAGELCLSTSKHDAGTKAVSSLYWRYEQWIRRCEASVDSPNGVYGGFYALRRELAAIMPQGLILDDMYEPMCVVRQGFRAVLDEQARVWDVWPKTAAGEFHRKVRTLAGNYQLLQLAPWLLGRGNRLRGQLISHKLLRLAIPGLLVILAITSCILRGSEPYRGVFFAQALFYLLAGAGLVCDIPVLRRVSGAASAFLMLNAAALVATFKFFLLPESLSKIWVVQPEVSSTVAGSAPERDDRLSSERLG